METALRDNDPKNIDGYAIVSRLGEGATGVVFRAIQSDGLNVALKVLRVELANDVRVRESLKREADALQRVSGGRTVRVIKVESEGVIPYLVMELVPGQSLDRFVDSSGRLSGGLLWSTASGLVEALISIHESQVIHRDLKPSNIMIGSDGVKVVDFGISSLLELSSLTNTGAFIGTAAWVSPEQVTGKPVTKESDIFSLGMVLSYAATGFNPFGDGRADAVMFRIAHESPDLSQVPAWLRPIIEVCLNKNPKLRPSLTVIQELLAGSTFSQEESDVQDVGTRIVGQTVIEAEIQKVHQQPSVTTLPKHDERDSKKQFAILGAIVLLIVAVFFVQKSSSNSSSLGETAVENSVVVDPVDTFKSFLESSFVNKVSSKMTESVGFGFSSFSGTTDDERSSPIWGTQLDCDDYYPLADLGFSDLSSKLISGQLTNLGGIESGSYVIDYRFFTGFNQDPMNFTRRAAVAESKFNGCSDTDYYPSADVAISPCFGDLFKDESWAFPKINEACAKNALRNWNYDATGKSTKVGFYPDTPANGRIGSTYVFSATPTSSYRSTAAVQWAGAVVWEKEDIGLVVSVSGYSAKGSNVRFDALEKNTISIILAAFDVASDIFDQSIGS